MSAPHSKEERLQRIQRALDRFEHKPQWLKKRAQKDYAFETWKKKQPMPADTSKPKIA